MLITLNGQPRRVLPGRLSALLVELLPELRPELVPASGVGAGLNDGLSAGLNDGLSAGIAVAVNGEVVPRSDHAERWLRPGDVIDVVCAVAGG